MKICVMLLMCLALCFQNAAEIRGQEGRENMIIRQIPMLHCKKGPARCEKCRARDFRQYCLLKLCASDGTQRPVIEVTEKGKKVFREYEVVKIFYSQKEARIYSQEHGISDVLWEDAPSATGHDKK